MDQILTILGSVGFNWHVALANFFNFLIIFFLLQKFFFKKLGKTIGERHALIERGLTQARDAEIALVKANEEKDALIHAAHIKAKEIAEAGEVRGEERASAIIQNAEKEISMRLEKLKEKEDSLKEDVEKQFNEKAPMLVAKLYAKTLLKELSEEDNNALIANMKA